MKRRLDLELVARGLADSRSRAQLLIKEERVEVAGETVGAPAYKVDAETPIRITDPLPYVSRAALKLRAALDRFAIDVAGAICLDIGASTGGFTQLLVERGAARVYAVDVGHGQMHPKVLGLPQVRSFEGVNARNLTAEQVREPVDLIVCDASFISLKKVLPTPLGLAGPRAHLVALVKPQFEVGRQAIGKGGIVRDRDAALAVVEDIAAWLQEIGWTVMGTMESPIPGGDGNIEYLIVARRDEAS